jgi:protein-S-isoprenylcysteine O-methyltransferase Ste14
VRTGFYRLVRHPIYAGYVVTHAAFCLAHPTFWNLAVFIVADVTLLVRAGLEERTLALDEEYVRYRQKVRWRVVPGLY